MLEFFLRFFPECPLCGAEANYKSAGISQVRCEECGAKWKIVSRNEMMLTDLPRSRKGEDLRFKKFPFDFWQTLSKELPKKETLGEEFVQRQVLVRVQGVGVMTGLGILGGLVNLFFGGVMLVGVVLLDIIKARGIELPAELQERAAVLEALGGYLGFVLVIFSFSSFVISYGFWKGKSWAWKAGLVVANVGIIIGILTLIAGVLSIIFYAIIDYYLTRPRIKKFFGKEPSAWLEEPLTPI